MKIDALRRALILASPLLSVAGCAHAAKFICPTDADLSNLDSPLTIDVHTHVFNGSDLQVKAFLSRVATDPDSELHFLINALGSLLQFVAWEDAPSAKAEIDAMESYIEKAKTCSGQPQKALASRDIDAGYRRGVKALNDALNQAKGDAPMVLGPGSSAGVPFGAEATIKSLPDSYEAFEQLRLASSQTLAGKSDPYGYVRFVVHNFNYRYVNVIDYLETYSKNSPRKIDLMVANMVDFDWWLNQGTPTKTTLQDQVEIMGKLSVATGGRMHGFVPFCPFREAMTIGPDGIGDSMRLVKTALESNGFIGVKLYPPMGFAAYGNKNLNVWMDKTMLPAAAHMPDFGARLDSSLARLYSYCIANDVPVMAHTNISNGPSADFRALAGSEHWELALREFPTLRVNFGHFGDTDAEDHQGARSKGFARLMRKSAPDAGSGAFADSAYFAGVLNEPDRVTEVLKSLYSAPEGGLLAERLMYGSDWEMSLTEKNIDFYLSDFISVMKTFDTAGLGARGTTMSNAFFGANAVQFLGLGKGQKSRLRVEAFYAAQSIPSPDWLKKIG